MEKEEQIEVPVQDITAEKKEEKKEEEDDFEVNPY